MFYYFDELPSTIDETRDARYLHGDVVAARLQTAGRGQRGRVWSAAAGENLTFSVVLDSSFLRVAEQFLLLQAVALALVDTLAGYGVTARVKWPNDIYVGDRKITGVLIDHSPAGVMLARSGVGVGLNVNQTAFPPELSNATSMALEAGREFDLAEVLARFHGWLMARFDALKSGARDELRREYHSLIYRLNTPALYELPDGERFEGTIRGVGEGGELTMERDGTVETYLFREISFVI